MNKAMYDDDMPAEDMSMSDEEMLRLKEQKQEKEED